MTEADLKAFVGASDTDDDFVSQCWDAASALVTQYVGTNTVPADIVDRATLEVGSELFHRRQAPNGLAQFAAPDGTPVRRPRDPMVAGRPILAPYLPLGFA
ncbi:hypothetical protein [Agromyces sp. S2-1-8]|uniref:hypothetical protein n=1 Tax=Agromyces sp. S2-1-8 TaxID=2897180 RepID=UPI001E4B5F8A|nr:hypothetical protein [Agromyces sp. S2-1-8]MCD5345054.1 hypothetical protein [Agromyces sp. S2-1-8]